MENVATQAASDLIVGHDFRGQNMPTNLENRKFLQCKFDSGTIFKNRRLNGTIFEGCQLDGVDFSGTGGMKQVTFSDCELHEVNFSRKNLYDLKILKSSATFCNFFKAALHDAELRDVNFKGTDFSGSKWSCTHFYKCDFTACQTVRTGSVMIAAVELCTNVPENVRKKACSSIEAARLSARMHQNYC